MIHFSSEENTDSLVNWITLDGSLHLSKYELPIHPEEFCIDRYMKFEFKLIPRIISSSRTVNSPEEVLAVTCDKCRDDSVS